MGFAQLTYRDGLRDVEACLRSLGGKLYHMGFHGRVSRSTLADANDSHDWRIYADFAQVLIRLARPLYVSDPIGVDLGQGLYALDSTTIDSAKVYPDGLRRVSYLDVETGKRFKFLTNNFALPALTIAQIYKARWQVELFFKWIKKHLRIKSFYGTSENAVKTQIWIAVSVYVLVVIVRKRLKLEMSLYQILQILSVTLFEKTPILQVLQPPDSQEDLLSSLSSSYSRTVVIAGFPVLQKVYWMVPPTKCGKFGRPDCRDDNPSRAGLYRSSPDSPRGEGNLQTRRAYFFGRAKIMYELMRGGAPDESRGAW
jgi:hypothetical protein